MTQPSPLTMLLSRHTRRCEFITLLGGAAAVWPLDARAQQADRIRRVGVLTNLSADDREGQARITAFLQKLQHLGRIDGRNVQINTRWDSTSGKLLEVLKQIAPGVWMPISSQ